ncbi:hypothetical protein ABIA22_003781 [Sinorhizobium fredii]
MQHSKCYSDLCASNQTRGAVGSEAIASAVPSGTTFDNRLYPDENLLRQNASI